MMQDRHRDQRVAFGQADTAHPDRITAGKDANIGRREADGPPLVGGQEDIVLLGAEHHIDDLVVLFLQLHRNLAIAIDLDEVRQLVAADRALVGGEHDIHVGPCALILGQGHDRGDRLALLQRQEIDQGLASRIRRTQRQAPGLGLVDHAAIGEEEERRVGRGHEERGDEVLVLGRHARAALAAAALGAIVRQGRTLGIAAMGDGHHHLLTRDQILILEVELGIDEFGAARCGVILANLGQLVPDHAQNTLTRAQQVEEVGNLFGQRRRFIAQLFTAETGQAVEAQFQDRPRLFLGEAQRIVLAQHGPRIGDQFDQRGDIQCRPVARHQLLARRRRVRRLADQGDDFIDIGHSQGEADNDMRPVTRLVELELGPACDDFLTEAQELLEDVQRTQQLRTATNQRQHVGTETGLHGRPAEELVENDIGDGIALQFDHDTHAIAVTFVTQIGNALDLLVTHKVGDLLDHRGLVHLVGDFMDDDRHAVLAYFLDRGARPHHHRAAPGQHRIAGARTAQDETARREVRTRDTIQQFGLGQRRIFQQGQRAIDHFAQIVWRDIGRHADGDTAGTIHQ